MIDDKQFITFIICFILLLFIIFYFIREYILWYFKINKRVELEKEILATLKRIETKIEQPANKDNNAPAQ